jgi:hypothetical protein
MKKQKFVILIILLIGGIFIWREMFVSLPELTLAGRADTPRSNSPVSSRVGGQKFTSKRDELLSLLNSDNALIEFYGIVQDENGNPLSNVEVVWDILKSGSFAPSLGLPAGSRGTLRTTADGRFTLKDESGSSISINSLNCKGYHNIENAPRSFGYGSNAAPHKPDASNPVRFIMSKDGTKKSIKKDIRLRFDWDARSKEIPLQLPGRTEVMIITPTRTQPKPDIQGYDWTIRVMLKNGQLVVGNNSDVHIAPIDGYISEITLARDVAGQRGSCAEALLYIKTTDNHFGEIRFSAYSDGDISYTGSLFIRWNPDGGRTFE